MFVCVCMGGAGKTLDRGISEKVASRVGMGLLDTWL